MYKVSIWVLFSSLLHQQVTSGKISLTNNATKPTKMLEITRAGVVDSLVSTEASVATINPATGGRNPSIKVSPRQSTPNPPTSSEDLRSLQSWMESNNDRADCFFVTTARLLGTSVEDISCRAGIPVPEPGSGGVSLSTMVNALQTLGIRFRIFNIDEDMRSPGGGPVRNCPAHSSDVGLPSYLALAGRNIGRNVGIAYVRSDGSGHVVVGRNPGRPYARYLDYQASRDGANVAQEVNRARVHAIFSIDLRASTGDLISTHMDTIENNEAEAQREHGDTSEPMEVDDDILRRLIASDFAGLNCGVILAGVLKAYPRPKRSLGSSILNTRDDKRESDCEKARQRLQSGNACGGTIQRQGLHPMLEILQVHIDDIDGEDPGELYGTIKVTDTKGSRLIYNQDRGSAEDVSPNQNIFLMDPFPALVPDKSIFIDFDLKDKDTFPLNPDDEVSKGRIVANVSTPATVFDTIQSQPIKGQYGSATVKYVVLSDAAHASIEVVLIDGDGESTADVYGWITAKNKFRQYTLFETLMLQVAFLKPKDVILRRNGIVTSMDDTLVIEAHLMDYDRFSRDDEIANGSAEFRPQHQGSSTKSIKGKWGEIQITVTWS
ncbi:hypothetical protein QQS21_011640 [Conoideocrella luteorostrata]|uniref:DUF6598 domain-containing protein n=1 Tax=Conoideocrella luteorostrata TaxID=1105319 RepID=A0AAJ0CD22_9HYPO|nr:hypothetical protein QQS21_011640 [Conoideocrella luteorostrata]